MDPVSPKKSIKEFYREHPEMVSSPFGGVSYYRYDLIESVWANVRFDVPAGSQVLEVGCGRAFLKPWLEKKSASYTGVDLTPSRGVEAGPGPDVLALAERLPFPDQSFHRLVCIDAFEHFPEPKTAVEEFHRVLTPGGELFLSSPNYGNIAGLVKKWMESAGGWEKDTWAPFGGWKPQAHEHALTLRKVRNLFQEVGFQDGRVVGSPEELHLGIFPWAAHPGFPESILFRIQRSGTFFKRWTAHHVPTLSLHQFWRWTRPRAGQGRV